MALDISARRMQMDNAANIKSATGNYPLVENSIYAIGDSLYIQGLFPDQPKTWTKTTVTEKYWEIQNTLKTNEITEGNHFTISRELFNNSIFNELEYHYNKVFKL